MSDKRKVILDCDPGHDDAFAIMLAAAHMDVLGITTIGGNCSLENVTRNALKVLEVIDRQDIKVYPGHSHPLVAPLVTAPQFHGPSGMDGPVLPEPVIKAQDIHGVDFIVDTVMSNDDVTLIATGPLTNIAAAINKEPRIVERVKELSIMGGSVTYGNWTPAAEFNIFVDPEAAYRVFNSGMHVKMCGVNLTRQCFLVQKHVDQFYKIGTRSAVFAAQLVGEMFYQAIAVSCIANVMWTLSIKKGNMLLVVLASNFLPIMSTFITAWMLGLSITMPVIIGSVLVVAGTMWSKWCFARMETAG